MNNYNTVPRGLSPVTDAIGKIHFEGNVVPHAWYSHPKLRTEAGTLHFTAIHVLANLLYWYRPVVERDEITQEVVRVRNKFSGERYRIDYAAWAVHLGLTKRQVQDAITFLHGRGIVVREVADCYEVGKTKYYNAVLVHPIAAVIAQISEPKVGDQTLTFQRDTPSATDTPDGGSDTPSRSSVTPYHGEPVPPLTSDRDTPYVPAGAINGDSPETPLEISVETTTTDSPTGERARLPIQTQRVVANSNNKIIHPKSDTQPSVGSLLAESLSREPHERNPLVVRLVDMGVTENVAEDLVADYPHRVEAQITYLPYRDCRNNQAGLLRTAIESNYAPPASWVAAEETKARREREREQAAAAAVERAVREAQRARDEAQIGAIAESLSASERESLERTIWHELAGIAGPAGSKAQAVRDGRTDAREALKSHYVAATYDRIRREILGEMAVKTQGGKKCK